MKKFFSPTTFLKYLTCLSLLSLTPWVLAKIPRASEIVSLKGERIMFQRGSQRRTKAEVGNRLENKNQKLIVMGNNSDLARLVFIGADDSYNGLILQAGPDTQETEYSFPCILTNGKITIGWQQGTDRDCEDGIFMSTRVNNNKNHAKNWLARSPQGKWDIIIIKPAQPTDTLVQVDKGKNRQVITPLIADIMLTTPNHPEGLKVEAGQQWSYDEQTNQESVNAIDPQSILKSPELEDFLDSNNWSSDSLPPSVNSDVQEQIITLNNPPRNDREDDNNDDQPLVNAFCQIQVDRYLANLRATLNGSWSPPRPPRKGVWEALLNYTITNNGQVQDVRVVQTSGYQPLDQAAVNHVYNLEQNFSDFPDCYRGNKLPVDHNFRLLFL